MQAHSSLISPNADTPLHRTDGEALQMERDTPNRLSELSDSEREAAIRMAGKLVEKYMADHLKYLRDFDITNDFGDKGLADGARLKAEEAARQMALLIKGRSPEQVARMEAERGLA